MNILAQLNAQFPAIKKAYWETETGETYLRVATKLTDLAAITVLSRQISDFLDRDFPDADPYLLDVFSSGTETLIKASAWADYLGQNVRVVLKTPQLKQFEFEGQLLTVATNEITLQYNKKGQFQKITVARLNIHEILQAAMIKKRKR